MTRDFFIQVSSPIRRLGSHLLVSLICLASSTLIADRLEAAVGLSLGLAAMEEGDERLRPSASVLADFGDNWSLQLQTFGRRQGPATQTSYLTSFARNYKIFSFKAFRARVGAALAYEQTSIKRLETGTEKTANTNFGLYLGLNWQSSTRLFVNVDWGSAIFPAGSQILLLAVARKQSFGLGLGWRI